MELVLLFLAVLLVAILIKCSRESTKKIQKNRLIKSAKARSAERLALRKKRGTNDDYHPGLAFGMDIVDTGIDLEDVDYDIVESFFD